MEDETARHIAALIGCSGANLSLAQVIQNTAAELGISLSAKQHEAVEMVFHNNLSMITGSPGTGKTTVLKVLIHAYRKLFRKHKSYWRHQPERPAAVWRILPAVRTLRRCIVC